MEESEFADLKKGYQWSFSEIWATEKCMKRDIS